MTNADKLRGCFAKALMVPEGDVTEGIEYGKSPKSWDSIGHMELVFRVEETFGVMLSPEDMIGMDSFQHALAIIERNLAEMEQRG